jgi:hypothetical protein
VRRGGLWAKHRGLKARYYWEHPWGTHWELKEHIGNMMGTQKGTDWEQGKNVKNPGGISRGFRLGGYEATKQPPKNEPRTNNK